MAERVKPKADYTEAARRLHDARHTGHCYRNGCGLLTQLAEVEEQQRRMVVERIYERLNEADVFRRSPTVLPGILDEIGGAR